MHDTPAGFGPARAVADAVLYKGYLLYPYRRSSAKNRVRWQFGVLAPPCWVGEEGEPGVAGSVESTYQQADCLLGGAPRPARGHARRSPGVSARRYDAIPKIMPNLPPG